MVMGVTVPKEHVAHREEEEEEEGLANWPAYPIGPLAGDWRLLQHHPGPCRRARRRAFRSSWGARWLLGPFIIVSAHLVIMWRQLLY